MEEYRKYILALRKCAIEHDNDETSFAHIVVSDLCRDTANLLETLEQEPILDKIRAEIGNINLNEVAAKYEDRFYGFQQEVIKILDKYKAESEVNK